MLNEQLKRRNNTYEEETLWGLGGLNRREELAERAGLRSLGGHRLLVRDPEGCQEPGGPSHGRLAGLSQKENSKHAWPGAERRRALRAVAVLCLNPAQSPRLASDGWSKAGSRLEPCAWGPPFR